MFTKNDNSQNGQTTEKEIGEIFGRGTYLCKGHNPTTREKKDRTLNFDHSGSYHFL